MIGQKLTLNQKIFLRQFNKPIIVFDNLPNELQIENSFGVPNSSWNEPMEVWHKTHEFIMDEFLFIPWENNRRPILGVWFDGNEWKRMFGYREPHFAPGLSWENEYIPRQYKCKNEFDYDWFNKIKGYRREFRDPPHVDIRFTFDDFFPPAKIKRKNDHTKGKWDWMNIYVGGNSLVFTDNNMEICEVIVKDDKKEQDANMKLISAAPDMLEALENIENDDGSIPDTIWKMVKDAINKAKGEE